MLYWYLRVRNWMAEREEGQDLIEYALLAGLIAIVAVAAITASGDAIKNIWTAIQGALEAVPAS